MATKLKRTLFVGLGGSGMKALCYTKKLFYDTYGEVPPMIGFIGIDTDRNAYSKNDVGMDLLPSEQLSISVENPRDFYLRYHDRLTWIPDRNGEALTKLNEGAGQVRTNGRFAFSMNYETIVSRVKQAINNICNANIGANHDYELLGNDVEINLIFSIAGGTGCGTFLDAAFMLNNIRRQMALNGKLVGYCILPDVYDAQLRFDKDLIKPNAYGALMDLDYLMHLDVTEQIELDYLTVQGLKADTTPFNAVFLASNRNNNGDTFDHADQIAEMISLALVTGAGELSTAAASVADNAEKKIISHTYDIGDKKAWASGLGISEIVFSSNELALIYSYKVGRLLIENLRNSGLDAEVIANNWIDEFKIRENNGHDDVIDYLMEKNPRYTLSGIDDKSNPKPEVERYLQSVAVKADELEQKLNTKEDEVEKGLYSLMVERSNGKYGVGGSRNILTSIQGQVNICIQEMQDELDELHRREPGTRAALDSAINELKAENGKFFKFGKKEREAEEAVCEAAYRVAIQDREIRRRDQAVMFYTWLLTLIDRARRKLEDTDAMLARIYDELGTALTRQEYEMRRQSKTFVIDLSTPYISKVVINKNDVDVNEFVKTLGWTDGVYEFCSKPYTSVKDVFMKYSETTNGADQWRKRDVEGALRELDIEERRNVFNRAISQSAPLFPVNFRGYIAKNIPDYFYIGVPDKNNTTLRENDELFTSLLSSNVKPDFSSIGGTDRIIIYRQYGVVPPFALTSTVEYKRAYDAWNKGAHSFSCHFDENLYRRMTREQFSLVPTETGADDAMALWVNGLIFGLIKRDGQMYMYRDTVNGDPLDDYWCELSDYRDEAFMKLRGHLDDIEDEFENYIHELRTSRGEEEFQRIISDARLNYLEKYSCNTLTRAQLRDRANIAIADQLRNELKYVREKLGE